MSFAPKEFLRHLCVCGFALALGVRSRPFTLPPGPLLVVAPHPDDETLGCGGLIASAARAGVAVYTIFLTDGEASHDGHPEFLPSDLARLRKTEALAALAALGVDAPERTTRFFGAPDGRLDQLAPGERDRIGADLTALIRELRPAFVLAPYRAGGSTEHAAAFDLVRGAGAAAGGATLLEYPIWAWWNPFRLGPRLLASDGNLHLALDAATLARKRRALACHRSQVEPTPPWPQAVLPAAISRACLARREFFFRHEVLAGPSLSSSQN